jgi:hypothetical protein
MKPSIILLSLLISAQIRAQRPIPSMGFEIYGSFGEIQGNDTHYRVEAVCEMEQLNVQDSIGKLRKPDISAMKWRSDSCNLQIQFVEGKSRMFQDNQLIDGYWEFSWDIHPFNVKRKIKITELKTGKIMFLIVENESKYIHYVRLDFEPGEYALMSKLK